MSNIITSVNTSVPIKGTGKSLGLYDGTYYLGTYTGSSNNTNLDAASGNYDVAIGTSRTGGSQSNLKVCGVTTDETKSGIVGTVTSTMIICEYIIKY